MPPHWVAVRGRPSLGRRALCSSTVTERASILSADMPKPELVSFLTRGLMVATVVTQESGSVQEGGITTLTLVET